MEPKHDPKLPGRSPRLRRRPWQRIIGIIAALAVVLLLWRLGANSLLRASLSEGNVRKALIALHLGANPDGSYNIKRVGQDTTYPYYEGETCLIRAIKLGSPKAEPILREMIRRGADPRDAHEYSEGGGGNGWATAFDLKNASVVQTMLEAGAELGENDIYWAVLLGNREILSVLFSHGVSPDAVVYGQGLIHIAAGWGNLEAVEYLLEKGVPIDATRPGTSGGINGDFQTPLMVAAGTQQVRVIQYLLRKGASVKPRDVYGRTVLDVAIQTYGGGDSEHRQRLAQDEAIVLLLKKHGAKATGLAPGR